MNVQTRATPHYDPFDYGTHEDPYPIYKALRDHAPAYFNEKYGFWALSRYADCVSALRDFKTFSSAQGTNLEPLKAQVAYVQTVDPPDHTRLRHMIAPMLTPQRVVALEEIVRRMARELLAPHLASGKLDVIVDFAARLPMAIICQLLGFPREDEDMVRGWTDMVVHREEGVFDMPEAGLQATLKLYDYFQKAFEARRGKAERGDLMDRLIAAEAAGTLTHDEMLGYLYILSIAGNETTTKLIGTMTTQLHHNPDQKALLLADPSLARGAVEETLRLDGPTQMQARTTTRDVPLHGRTIEAGRKVALLFISANRDERHFTDPDRFDIKRNAVDHLGFGGGLHSCLGSALARLEGRVALEEMMRLLPDFVVDESGLQRMHSPAVRGYTHVPVAFTPRATP
jgi:cytochrome P450